MVRTYDMWLRSYDGTLRPYVEMMLAVFDFIEGSERPNKRFYFNLVRASLSRQEKTLLFYHAISIPEHERLQAYIERYSLFREMDPRLLHQSERDIRTLYQASAYDPTIAYQPS